MSPSAWYATAAKDSCTKCVPWPRPRRACYCSHCRRTPAPADRRPVRPRRREADLGGDLYAAARTVHPSTRLLIGDVRGNGLAAISDATLLLGAFRAAAHRQATLPRLAVHLDGVFRWTPANGGHRRSRTPTRTLPPRPCSTSPTTSRSSTSSPSDTRPRSSRAATTPPPSRPRRATCRSDSAEPSDGVIEARDGDGHFYPFTKRAPQWTKEDPDELLRRLREDLLVHVHGRLGDDAAVVAIRRLAV
ncbi:SpoIIE family protein phosphatase [Streptomyces sp. NPDC051920]|uniref:SpoIIE family protein phosphatase n=1 Tax=Streptomyces sp. NPDC051920 TaxID=3155523 RepID=UPI00343FF017